MPNKNAIEEFAEDRQYRRLGDLAERMVTLAQEKQARVLITWGVPFNRHSIEATPSGFTSHEIVQDSDTEEVPLAEEPAEA
jgi:hypothetical protein